MTHPKPWSMNEYGRVVDADGDLVVFWQNYAEIVRAVNCHADLLAACELLLSGPTEEAVIAAREAVKKARVE